MFQKIKKIIKIETNASIFIYISSKIEKYLLHFCTKLKKFLCFITCFSRKITDQNMICWNSNK